MLGDDTSGEVEPVLVGAADRLWVTVGADHTDRKLESYGVAASKQVCPKVIGRTAWRFEEVEPHWDRLMLRSFVTEGGKKVLYQEGPLARIRAPRDLIAGWRNGEKRLPAGAAMFCGTLPCDRRHPVLVARSRWRSRIPCWAASSRHAYEVTALPIVS